MNLYYLHLFGLDVVFLLLYWNRRFEDLFEGVATYLVLLWLYSIQIITILCSSSSATLTQRNATVWYYVLLLNQPRGRCSSTKETLADLSSFVYFDTPLKSLCFG